MSPLQEIEKAVPLLSQAEIAQLEMMLRKLRQLKARDGRKPDQRLSEFFGVINLPQDPLDWQKTLRQEWD